MKRLWVSVVAGISLAGGVCGSVAAAALPRAEVVNLVCHRALDPRSRAVAITAVMRPVAGTRQLRMKIDLLSKPPGAGPFSPVGGNGEGAWLEPKPVVPPLGSRRGDVFKVPHRVTNLPAPATYRFRVSYRWLGTSGQVLSTAHRTSGACREPELRPDLLVQSFASQPIAGKPQLNRYVAVILNGGASAAPSFEAEFSDGAAVKTKQINRLPAHRRRILAFTGPLCLPSNPPTLTLDPQGQVDDYNRANNTAIAVC